MPVAALFPILFAPSFVRVSVDLSVLGGGGKSQAAPGQRTLKGTDASLLALTPFTLQTVTSASCRTSASMSAGTAWAATAASALPATG